MHWIVPSEKDSSNGTLEKRLWDSTDQFRADSGLKELLTKIIEPCHDSPCGSQGMFALSTRTVTESRCQGSGWETESLFRP